MKRTSSRSALLIIFTFAFTAVAHAVAPQRTFVSAQQGNDANVAADPPCSVTLPCRQFNVAIGAVLAGGEVVALDSGGYGPVSIAEAVTLVAPTGVYASIRSQTAGLSAITVTAAITDTVVLRGLTLVGVGGENGINVTSVGNLHIEGCVVSGFVGDGIKVQLAANGSYIFIKDTVTRNNDMNGIIIATTAGMVRASIDNCRAERNGISGFVAYLSSRVAIKRSVASGNPGVGFYAASDASGVTAELSCEECLASQNGTGFASAIDLGGLATMRVAHSVATHNNTGFVQINTAVFESLGNNMARGNTTNNKTGTITAIAPD